jgi:hypothetical protein
MTTMTDSRVHELERRAHDLFARAGEAALDIRLLGGMAIRILLGDRLHPVFERPIRDLDLLTRRKHARGVEQLLAESGWEPDEQFNALNGARRMLFHEPGGDAQVDVFVESFEMCHRLPLAECLDRCETTLPAAELLMTKLQIVELNAKDRSDLYALLATLPVGDHDDDVINARRIAELTARDWGLHHTFELNVAHLRDHVAEAGLDEGQRLLVGGNLDLLEEAMDAAEKSRGWRLRAKVGERKRWYEDVEEVERA